MVSFPPVLSLSLATIEKKLRALDELMGEGETGGGGEVERLLGVAPAVIGYSQSRIEERMAGLDAVGEERRAISWVSSLTDVQWQAWLEKKKVGMGDGG